VKGIHSKFSYPQRPTQTQKKARRKRKPSGLNIWVSYFNDEIKEDESRRERDVEPRGGGRREGGRSRGGRKPNRGEYQKGNIAAKREGVTNFRETGSRKEAHEAVVGGRRKREIRGEK